MSYLVIHEEPGWRDASYWVVISPMYHFTTYEAADNKRRVLDELHDAYRIRMEGLGYPPRPERVRVLDLTNANVEIGMNEQTY